MTEPTTRTLDLPGAMLTYDVREAEPASTEPAVMMVGSPMDASGFMTLAGHFPDRTAAISKALATPSRNRGVRGSELARSPRTAEFVRVAQP